MFFRIRCRKPIMVTIQRSKVKTISSYLASLLPCTVRFAPQVTLCTYEHEPLRFQGFFGAGGVTRTHDLLITKCIQTLRLTVFRDFGAFPPRILRMSCPICSVVSTRSFPRVGHGVGQKRSLNPATSFTERRKRWISL